MKLLLNALVLTSIVSCNGKAEKIKEEPKTEVAAQKKVVSYKGFDIANINFDETLKQFFDASGLSLNGDQSQTTNLNMDYEEFVVPDAQEVAFFGVDLSKKFKEFSIFYPKSDQKIFCYELSITDQEATKSVIKKFEEQYGKPLFSKQESSKTGTIFLDENGNPKKDAFQNVYQWSDTKSHAMYFLIHSGAGLNVIALNKNSPMYKQWIDLRSLNMVFDVK
ncbi:hypothetical protein [Soonwooa sp.]|uniref:hypothetical protein n=1 Tax=Soonwooa sp. TaxID=1938592 RepID=UPI00261D1028|nr:hypothetical protein [Soonwooa sp.]